jgi:membrane protein YqaA with SNARE-associated domain
MEPTYAKPLSASPARSPGRRLLRLIADRAHLLAGSFWSYVLFFGLGLLEGTFVTVSMDAVLLMLGIASPGRSIYFSIACILGSTVGGLIGYQLGSVAYQAYLAPLVTSLRWQPYVTPVLDAYRQHAALTLITSGYLPLPYALVTWLAGADHTVPWPTFAWTGLLGRTLRFLPTGLLLYYMGPRIVPYIEKYIGRLLLVCTLLVGLLLWYQLSR